MVSFSTTESHLGSVGWYGHNTVGNDNYVLEGVSDEDENPAGDDKAEEEAILCAPRKCWGRWLNHCWNPNLGYDSKFLPGGSSTVGRSAIRAAERLWGHAVYHYRQDTDKGRAYYYLGRVAHLLGDMSVPAHVHLDPHSGPEDCDSLGNCVVQIILGDDSYEEWMRYTGIDQHTLCNYNSDSTIQCNFEQFTINSLQLE